MPKQKQTQNRQPNPQQQVHPHAQEQQASKPVAGANVRKPNRNNHRNNNNNQGFIYVPKSTILKNLLESESEQERRVKEIEDSIRSELMQRKKEQKSLDEEKQRREELEMKKEREEADERLRKMEIIRIQKEETEKANQLERTRIQREVGDILEQMIGKIEAVTEKRIADLKYLKSREGLIFLLESDFADFSDQISTDLPPGLLDFTSRNYIISQSGSSQSSSYNRKKQTSFSNKDSQRHNNQSKSHIYVKKDNGIPKIDKLTKDEEDEVDMQHWRSQQAQRYSLQKDELKFFLNVLTPDNFENLKDQFFSHCQVDASKCIHQLINKVCKESKYTKLYSQLAIYVREREEKQTKDKQLTQKGNEKGEQQLSCFRSQMLYMLSDLFYDQNKLKKLLRGSNSAQENSALSNDISLEKSTQESQDNKRFQTFLKFLGELFTAKFLPKKIISYCIQTMMQQFVQNGLQEEDRNIEGIVSLIDSIGPEFEASWKNPSSKQSKLDLEFLNQVRSQYSGTKKTAFDSGFFEKEFISFQGVMNFLVALNTANRVSVMLSSLIVNLMHRWQNGWEKALHQKENPRTLKELHQQHYEELNKRSNEVEDDLRNSKNYMSQQYVPAKIQLKPKENNNNTNNFQQKIKQILSDLDSNQSDPIDCIHQIEKLRQQNPADTFKHLLSQFFNTRLDNLSRRCSLVKDFLDNYSNKDTRILISAMNSIFNSMFSQACDFPHIYESFADITYPLIAKGLFSFSDFSQLPCDDPDDAEDKSYFFQELQSHFLDKEKAN